jgi:hypothetical protein
MEIVLPFVALGGMYIISNRTSEPFENNETNDNIPLLKTEFEDENDKRYEVNDYLDANQTTDKFFDKDIHKQKEYTTLSGEVLKKDSFVHNNMVPFFGAKIKGNYDNYKINETILDNMTGTGSQQKNKVETAPLFEPSENMNFSHGAPNMNDFYQSRVNPSIKMSNVKPWKEERVAPGLNKGYTNEGASGYNSVLDERDTYMPKSVDELRVVTNPKASYNLYGHEGPINSQIKERGQFGIMEKHLPDTYYESGKDRWFTTTGIEKKQTARSTHINKVENRTTTTQEYEGVAKGNNFINYSHKSYDPSNKRELSQEQFTPAGANGHNNPSHNDYNATSYIDYKNNRNTNKNDKGFGIVGSALGAVISPIIDVLRPSRKENVIGNVRIHGDVNPSHPKPYINNQDDIRTTNRQMHPQSLNHYNMENQGDGGYKTATPNVVPTNRNDTSIYYSGVMGGSGLNEGVTTYDASYNQTNNDMKEATTYNRIPQGNAQTFNHLSSDHNIVKKESDRTNNRMWVPTTNPTSIPPSRETAGFTNITYDNTEDNRMEPDLLQAFKENPYTHSLNSVA